MNVNTTKSSNSKTQASVVSKYFSRDVMDDSLTDFKEKKPATKGPKPVQKPATSKPKKKITKKIKGQKDIRSALKSKKNDLIDYTKQFDDVCKVSGLDVETEQLLLAVALSKSLQKTDDTTEDNSSQSTQGRIAKIRTTLQEYGFTVPEIKISKKSRVCKKNYKLLLAAESEKQQIISDKYAQVLFDVYNPKLVEDEVLDDTNVNLYYKATNIPYKDIRDNDVFYVLKSLVEESTSVGSLLRNWSDIPGRPSSPVYCDTLDMDFSEIECSQEELNVILSGTLKSCKSMMRNKTRRKSITIIVEESKHDKKEENDMNSESNSNGRCLNVEIDIDLAKNRICHTLLSSSVPEKTSVATRSLTRSCSPDIFDDEGSGIIDNEEDNKDILYTQIIDDIIEDENKTIDLTQHTDDVTSKSLKCSQNNNFTRRHSNDVMEITDCVGSSSVKSEANNHGRKSVDISLSNKTESLSQQNQLSNRTKILNVDMEVTECVASTSMIRNIPSKTNIDLTQDSDEESEIAVLNSSPVSKKSHTPSSDDELPSVEVKANKDESLDDTIILNDDEINKALRPITGSDIFNENPLNRDTLHVLKHSPNKSHVELKSSQSFFEEFEHNHSDNTEENNDKSKSLEFEVCDDDENKIDLTQSSDETVGKTSFQEFEPVTININVMGKIDDVSIDYDEICNDDLDKSRDNISKASCSSQQSKVSIINNIEEPHNSNTVSESSTQNSVVFEICDQELNYSINKSRCDVPWDNFGGLSVMDDLSKLENSRNPISDVSKRRTCESNSSFSKSMSDSFLPIVALKATAAKENVAIEPAPTPKSTPLKIITKTNPDTVRTPISLLSSEYIIKTDQVTPILDYASMSTPERNRELDKYGLKPFKRKRAVQILTHLYNQTHPLIDSSEEMLSPSKKMKPNHNSPKKSLKSPNRNSPKKSLKSPKYNSPKKSLKSPNHNSPKKCLKSPKENEMAFNKENNDLYGVTKEVPDIVDIQCSEEDWVFQKREKAKLHSCRVPLHIAFHNYVSCRRALREAILRYEPVNIDDIHKGLVAIGFRYDPKDLLKYMDKKCITVKTADNNARNNKR